MKIRLMAAGVCLAALALTGCTSDGAGTPDGDGAAPPEAPTTAAGICDIVSGDDVSAAFDTTVGDGSARTGEESANEVEWTTAGCGWEGEEMEVVASIAVGDDFPGGFVCVEPGTLDGAVTPIDGLGTLAWWAWDDFQGGSGTVTVCGDDTRVEVTAEGPRDGPAIDQQSTRDGATAIATRIFEPVG